MPDLKDRIGIKAEEIALERYGREFIELPPQLEMKVWLEAEAAVDDENAAMIDAVYDRIKEDGAHHWDELELQRRLGK